MSPDQIGAAYGEVSPRFDDTPAIVQAVLAERVAGSVRCEARSNRIREIEEALAPACDRLPREEAEQATAVIVYLANALAWLSLRDESAWTATSPAPRSPGPSTPWSPTSTGGTSTPGWGHAERRRQPRPSEP